jgi:hypothetical protein
MNYMETFPKMVAALAKPGEDIAGDMNKHTADLWHGATGVATEAGELLLALHEAEYTVLGIDRVNLIEELGDMEFYLQQVRANIGITRADVQVQMSLANEDTPAALWVEFIRLAIAATDLLDAVKKVVIYNKEVDEAKFIDLMARIENPMMHIRGYFTTREAVIEANVTKLATGPNARYKGGYSDAAAQTRADKAEEDEHGDNCSFSSVHEMAYPPMDASKFEVTGEERCLDIIVRGKRGGGKTTTLMLFEAMFKRFYHPAEPSPVCEYTDEGLRYYDGECNEAEIKRLFDNTTFRFKTEDA